MKLTEENFNLVFDYIDSQVNDDVFGEFDEETNLLSAVERTIEMFEEERNKKICMN